MATGLRYEGTWDGRGVKGILTTVVAGLAARHNRPADAIDTGMILWQLTQGPTPCEAWPPSSGSTSPSKMFRRRHTRSGSGSPRTGRGQPGPTPVGWLGLSGVARPCRPSRCALDDDLGSDHVYDAARAESRLITRLLRENTYSQETGHRLHACAAEASRLAGWCAFDSGQSAAAETHFVTALRAAAGSGDRTAGATALAFWANVRYSNSRPDPRGALDLIDGALTHRADIASPRVLTMLYIRQARAHSIAQEPTAAYRAIDDALAAYDRGIPTSEDLQAMYWVNTGEVFQAAASTALSLGDPQRALTYFSAAATHHDPYDPEKEPRGTAIYLAREAEAYLALGDLDGAVETAQRSVGLMGGVSSARGSETLTSLRSELSKHRAIPVVKNFLNETA